MMLQMMYLVVSGMIIGLFLILTVFRTENSANRALKDISVLQDNWNENGAKSFSRELVEKCYKILRQLTAEPFICPTACGSIQFEYEKENGEYLEFEIYEDRIEVFSISQKGEEQEETFLGKSAAERMKQMVVDFYG